MAITVNSIYDVPALLSFYIWRIMQPGNAQSNVIKRLFSLSLSLLYI